MEWYMVLYFQVQNGQENPSFVQKQHGMEKQGKKGDNSSSDSGSIDEATTVTEIITGTT